MGKSKEMTYHNKGAHGSDLERRFEAAARRAAKLIAEEHPRAIGVVVDGSVGRREPLPHSDVDMLVIVKGERMPEPFSYFDDDIHVAVGFVSLKEYSDVVKNGRDFFWQRGGAKSARVLYDPRRILRSIVRKRQTAKAMQSIVEGVVFPSYCDMIEYVGKLRNGRLQRDERLTRYAARIVAEKVQEVVIALNNISPVSENIVWHQVMKARKKPRHFRKDYPVSLGIKGRAGTDFVFESAMRLARECVALVREEFERKAKNVRFKALLRQSLKHYGLE